MPRRDDAAEPVYVLTRDQVRELDRRATEEFGVPSIVLMENAARHVVDVALEEVEDIEHPKALILCGPGANGGDGFAAARHMHNAGLECVVMTTQGLEAYRGDARINAEILRRMKLRIFEGRAGEEHGALEAAMAALGKPDIVIDALFGTGLTRALGPPLARVVEGVNELGRLGATILAVDCPSGMDVDRTQGVNEPCVRASVTVTFAGLKPAFLMLEAQSYLGQVVVGDIGAPRELLERLGTRLSCGNPDHEAPPRERGTSERRKVRGNQRDAE